jgi:hypothetical protein
MTEPHSPAAATRPPLFAGWGHTTTVTAVAFMLLLTACISIVQPFAGHAQRLRSFIVKQAGGVATTGLPVLGVPAQAPPAPALGVDPCEAVHAQAEPVPVQAQELVLVTGGAGAW